MLELERVLIRPKFDRYGSLEKRLRFIASFVARAEHIDITESIALRRDLQDNHLLELAACGSATHLITDDQDLLVLNPLGNIVIQQPSEFLLAMEHVLELHRIIFEVGYVIA